MSEDILLKIAPEIAAALKGKKELEVFIRDKASGRCRMLEKVMFERISPEQAAQVRRVLNQAGLGANSQNAIQQIMPGQVRDLIRKQDYMGLQQVLIQMTDAWNQIPSKIMWVGTALSALNLAATITSTAIICQKLDKLSTKLDKLTQSVESIKRIQLESGILKPCRALIQEYKVFSSDAEKGKPVSEEKLLDAIKKCHMCLVSAFELRTEFSLEAMLEIINGLLPAFANMIMLYDQNFYHQEKSVHVLHQDWISFFDGLSNDQFLSEIQAELFLNQQMHNIDVNRALEIQTLAAQGWKVNIQMTLEELKACDSKEEYQQMQGLTNQYVMLYAQQLQTELEAVLGQEEAERIMSAAKGQAMPC